MQFIIRLGITLFFSLSFYLFFKKPLKEDAVVNVYDWYGMLSSDILQQFEKETGIKVQYDLYDNNEVLEAKLLASNCGYDVVFPTASPYVARQIKAGVYQPLQKELLSHLQNLNVFVSKEMEKVDPGMVYAIPYYWGTIGFAIDEKKIKELLPLNVELNSYDLLFNPENLKHLQKCGVSLLEEAVDVIPLVLRYLGKSFESEDLSDLDIAYHHLKKLRPYIRRFTSSRFLNDLVLGDVCIAQAWSGEGVQAEKEAKSLGRDIKYIIPKEGTTLWIDCIAIPIGAPHPINAHKFINFLMRPDIAAKITNATQLATTIQNSLSFINKEVKNNPSIYPGEDIMKKLKLDNPQTSEASLMFDRERTKVWAKVRLNR